MAPLKLSDANFPEHAADMYPWLRGHGSIEAVQPLAILARVG